jgi:hypothetical protein
MGIARLTKEDVQKRKLRIAGWEKQLERWELLRNRKEDPAFKLLFESVAEAKKAAEREVLSVAKQPTSDATEDRNVTLRAGGKLELAEMILGDMDPSAEKFEYARMKIAELKFEIEEATDRGGLVTSKER